MSDISSVVVEPGDEEAHDIATVSCESHAKHKEKKKRKQMSKEYSREWYHKHKTDHVCEWCGKTYICKSGLIKHQKRSTKCFVAHMKKEWQDSHGEAPMTFLDLKNVMDTWMHEFKKESRLP